MLIRTAEGWRPLADMSSYGHFGIAGMPVAARELKPRAGFTCEQLRVFVKRIAERAGTTLHVVEFEDGGFRFETLKEADARFAAIRYSHCAGCRVCKPELSGAN